jgi:AraC-like DNA-binding protein
MMLLSPEKITPVVGSAQIVDAAVGSVWGPRVIEDPELVLLVSGELRHSRGGESVRVRAGQVLLIEPGVEHRLEVVDVGVRTVMPCIHFEPIKGLRYSHGTCRLDPHPAEVTDTAGDYIVRDLFTRCAKVFEGYSRYRDAMLSAVFSELWVRLAEIWAGGAEERAGARLRAMLSYVRRNIAEEMSRSVVAAEFGVTPQHVNALFKKELGVTPSEFINRERVHRSSRLMAEEGLSVKEAAARVGFNDQFYFSRVFKRIMKFPPSRSM